MKKHIVNLWAFIHLVAHRFATDGVAQTAASLTYTTLLAIVPLITISLTIFSAFPAFQTVSTNLKIFLLENMLPESAGKVISVYMFQFSENAGKLTAIGTVILAITAFLLMQTIEHALNGIWHVRRARPWTQRLLIYWAVLTLGPVLIGGSLYVTSYFTSLTLGLGHEVHGATLYGLKFTPILLTVTAMSLLYLMVPNRYVMARHAWLGGLVAGVCFELMKTLFSNYVSHLPSYTMVYGAFAILPLFLLWIYLSWMVLLLGAVITAMLPQYAQGAMAGEQRVGYQFDLAVRTLVQLSHAHLRGEVLSLVQLVKLTHIHGEMLEQVLISLQDGHWVLRTNQGWALARHPDKILLRELFERLVFDAHHAQLDLGVIVRQPDLNLSDWVRSSAQLKLGEPCR